MKKAEKDIINTPAGPVPKVPARLNLADRLGMFKVRWGIGRMTYMIEPGLYAVGQPDSNSEVIVTANYRMTFDHVRSNLSGLDAWILVLDTRGINVWCAAGKGTFGTQELVSRIESSELTLMVNHRRLILPQLGAVGIAAHKVRELSGFKVLYGPVEARDIPAYLANGLKTFPFMRRKTFSLRERAALIPMELVPALKYAAMFTLILALLAGLLGSGSFLSDALHHGKTAMVALLIAVAAGAVLVPLLLPYLPGRSFSLKGLWTGLAAALTVLVFVIKATGSTLTLLPWMLLIPALSSFLGMNFTGSSTYTSLSGVRREMRFAVPLQVAASVFGVILWFSILYSHRGGVL
ncbi:acetyl-CoA synthase subunit gamma [bacterium]|nr:MAG: acetyl-CoA synthase subunit gamma [bacterium]